MTKFDLARKEIPKLIDEKFAELKKADPGAKYESAVREIGKEYPDLWTDYTLSVGSDGSL